MKVATVSTLWDYIRRAMPWNTPKSLSTEEVYAVTAYLLNMAGVLPEEVVPTPVAHAAAPFENGQSIGASAPTSSLAWGDVDGDGALDVGERQPTQALAPFWP